ncbi:anillin, actin binding protein 2 isoform X4 [Paramormyrops kingsleyae]|uniref:anillin, actin binding protein 2 isoform X4 n=1 Tax=Paramormyrops kingsleyae TaxID=1676925 RepID=UPI003B974FB5
MEPFLETSSCSRPDALELHSPDRKGVEDGIGAIGGQKRQRALLSDDEETSLPIPKSQESSKRRCLEPVGDENIDPLHRWPGSPERSRLRQQEQEVKPDTPAVSSVRARLQWLGQKQGDGAVPQRCLSDPVQGEPTCSLELHSIGNVEFHSRVERFETPPQSPAFFTPRSQVPSNLTRSMQQKLQSANTPSSVRASRIRQERQEELRLLRSQPIAENAWMKRSLSDPSLAEVNSLQPPLRQVAPRCRTLQWPPMRPRDVEASETRASNDEQPRPACSGDPACLLEPSKELHSSADKDLSEEMSTSGMIDQLFARVLDTEEEEEDKRRKGHCDSDAAEGKGEEMGLATEGVELESRSLDSSTDELLTLPSSCILSPLSKSVEAVVTDLRLASSCLPDVTSVDCVPEGPHDPPPSSTPLYSIDAYRTQLQNSRHAVHIVTPTASGQRPQASCPQPLINTKDRIKALSEDVAKLQVVITQTLQALSCCTDEDHWKGSPMEAEAEKLLLVSCEKRTALLAEVAQLRAGVESGDAVTASPSQEPCRGTVTIANIRLPLKVDFVCSSLTLAGRPTHYFFVLIRYGACNIVATPLAIAADAQTGDSISFPTSVTLQDIRSNFEIDVEVYSLSQTPGNAKNFNTERFSKSKVTPKKLLSSIKRTNHNAASTALTSVGPQRSSNFCLVGSHKLTLASLGQTKFPLDKMKFDGKVRKLLGDEFQEKVPFLSPLEGNIYLQLNYESHSNVQHKGFLTMFEAVCGLGSWQRRWFSLEGNLLLYWNSPSSEGSKPPEGSISLASRAYQCVRLVTRDSCARPHTFELVSYKALQEDSGVTLDKHWFSADTREERAEWMKKLNQALLDLHTWTCCPGGPEPPRPCRESML